MAVMGIALSVCNIPNTVEVMAAIERKGHRGSSAVANEEQLLGAKLFKLANIGQFFPTATLRPNRSKTAQTVCSDRFTRIGRVMWLFTTGRFSTRHAPPHFHALYAEHEALIDLRDLGVMRGSLPHRALALVLEWAAEHRDELLEDWNLCSRMQTPKAIEPLK